RRPRPPRLRPLRPHRLARRDPPKNRGPRPARHRPQNPRREPEPHQQNRRRSPPPHHRQNRRQRQTRCPEPQRHHRQTRCPEPPRHHRQNRRPEPPRHHRQNRRPEPPRHHRQNQPRRPKPHRGGAPPPAARLRQSRNRPAAGRRPPKERPRAPKGWWRPPKERPRAPKGWWRPRKGWWRPRPSCPAAGQRPRRPCPAAGYQRRRGRAGPAERRRAGFRPRLRGASGPALPAGAAVAPCGADFPGDRAADSVEGTAGSGRRVYRRRGGRAPARRPGPTPVRSPTPTFQPWEAAMAIATVNPATGETVKTFDALSAEEVDARIARAAEAFESYRLTTFAERAGWMRAAADILDAEADSVAVMMTTEMGKTRKAARAEAQKCAKACRFYADHAEGFLADEPVDPAAVGAQRALTRYQPIGVVLAVMPWNFPLWQAMRFAAPAL